MWIAPHLERPYPRAGTGSAVNLAIPAPLFGLASTGVYQADESPRRWWALTPPLHFRHPEGLPEFGTFFSVALSLSRLRPSLTANLPYEVPTFLSPFPASDRALYSPLVAQSGHYSTNQYKMRGVCLCRILNLHKQYAAASWASRNGLSLQNLHDRLGADLNETTAAASLLHLDYGIRRVP